MQFRILTVLLLTSVLAIALAVLLRPQVAEIRRGMTLADTVENLKSLKIENFGHKVKIQTRGQEGFQLRVQLPDSDQSIDVIFEGGPRVTNVLLEGESIDILKINRSQSSVNFFDASQN